ncbi:WD40-repeat-containing domain protein [Elsinoe ampelina]|uniref:WD40-repeat-containing domain protein n=1 Tax=Elsinoe ampelina TaxID=302913 RepID=A0A6A6GAJ0_9PEZI|nr:WD40-repeat-containing domain protein [Elsinoe ampelina]
MLPTGQFPVLHAITRLASQANTPKKKSQKRFIIADDDDQEAVVDENTPLPPVYHNNIQASIYDVKFYPYTQPDEDPVFAVVAARDVYVYRPSADPKDPVEMLRAFRDPQPDASLNSLVWSQDLQTGDPLICFGGAGAGNIKIVNVVKDEFVRNLTGHGGAINDLAISPLSPNILASASADYSIRIWNLDPTLSKQPCAAILASPDAHKQSVLAIAFHSRGAYLLSGGTDTMINMWAVPEVPGRFAGSDKVDRIYFPLFSSTEVHSDYVDCLRFHGDLIFSHAAFTTMDDKHKNNSILLWKIDGFSSAAPVPDKPPMPELGKSTRSAFGGRFQRLLTFDMPNSSPFYMRFSLFDRPDYHPILVMGNEKSRFSFWDLYALERESDMSAEPSGPRKYKKKRGGYRPRRGPLKRDTSVSTTKDSTPGAGNETDRDDYETANEDNEEDHSDDEAPTITEDTPSMGTKTPSIAPSEGRNTPAANGHEGSATPTITAGRAKPSPKKKARGKSTQQKAKESRFDVGDAFRPLHPHHTITVPKYNFTVRQVAWSNCGKWCVATGEVGIMCVFRRWVEPLSQKVGGVNGVGEGKEVVGEAMQE